MEPEPPDLRPLQQAIQKLRYTQALAANDDRYVERSDRLGAKLLERLLAPVESRLLLAGTPGCGKSTELGRFPILSWGKLRGIWCPLDVPRIMSQYDDRFVFNGLLLCSYLTSTHRPQVELSKEIRAEVRMARNAVAEGDSTFVAMSQKAGIPVVDMPANRGAVTKDQLTAVLHRLFEELTRAGPPPVLLIDGLEKLPPDKLPLLEELIRGPTLADVRSVIVVPHWRLYGWDSLRQVEGVEVLEVPQASDNDFVRRILARRLDGLIDDPALNALASLSGGVARDGLQLATAACRHAIDIGSPRVNIEHVHAAQRDLAAAYEGIFSDDASAARVFLKSVDETKALAGPPILRDRMLASGAVLLGSDKHFFVHPVLEASDGFVR